MRLAALLVLCCLATRARGAPPGFCSQDRHTGIKPGFPEPISTNDPGVLEAARCSVERFNNCTDDIFLFREAYILRALVQVVKGLKYMLEVEVGRTVCRKSTHTPLDLCAFQTSPTLKRTLRCYSEVWAMPWLHRTEVPLLRCQ